MEIYFWLFYFIFYLFHERSTSGYEVDDWYLIDCRLITESAVYLQKNFFILCFLYNTMNQISILSWSSA